MGYSALGLLSLTTARVPSTTTLKTTTLSLKPVVSTITIEPKTTTIPITSVQSADRLLSPTLLPSYTPPEAPLGGKLVPTTNTVVPVLAVEPATSGTSTRSTSTSTTTERGSTMDRRQAVEYLRSILSNAVAGTGQRGTYCIDLSDPKACAQRLVSDPNSVWRSEYRRLLPMILSAYGRTEFNYFYSFVYSNAKAQTGMDDNWVKAQILAEYQAVAGSTAVAKSTSPSTATVSTMTPRIVTSSRTPGGGSMPGTTLPMPGTTPLVSPEVEPMARPEGSVTYEGASTGTMAPDGTEIREFDGYQYKFIPQAAAAIFIYALEIMTVGGEVSHLGISWKRLVKPDLLQGVSSPVKARDVVREMMDRGSAILMAAQPGADPQILVAEVGADQIALVSDLTMNNEKVGVLAEPSGGWKKAGPNYLLYGGIAVAAVAGVGLLIYLTRK